jgi:hypothetical protein
LPRGARSCEAAPVGRVQRLLARKSVVKIEKFFEMRLRIGKESCFEPVPGRRAPDFVPRAARDAPPERPGVQREIADECQ